MSIGSIVTARRLALGWSQEVLAERAGTSQSTIDRIEKGDFKRMPSALPAIAAALDIPLGDLNPAWSGRSDVRPNVSAPMPAPELPQRQIPVYGVAVGGDDGRMKFNGERLDMVGCPPELRAVPNAYAVYVAGDSMVPSFKPGQIAWVHPNRTARPGQDVIVQLHPEQDGDAPEGFIKELVKLTPSTVVVRQYNPPKDITFGRDDVKSLHVVVFASR